MKKTAFAFMAGAVLLGTAALLADTGVVIHEKNGKVTFFPAESVDYVEFVENYSSSDENEGPSNSGDSETELPVFNLFTENAIEMDQTYLIVANSRCASPIDLLNTYGYLKSEPVDFLEADKSIECETLDCGFLFASSCHIKGKEYKVPDGKFLIKDSNGRYLYLQGTYTSFNVAFEPALDGNNIADNYLFSANKTDDGSWKIENIKNADVRFICYSSNYNNFAAYNSLSSSDVYPSLYILDNDYVGNGDDTYNGYKLNKIDGYVYPLSYVKLPEHTPQQIKEYTGFTVNFNKDNHTPNYVAWELLNAETKGSVNRNDYNYWVDKDLEGCLSTDYAFNTYGYERGHMCPAADQKWSISAMYDCMVMSNMVPQLRALNAGIWETLEEKERVWAQRDGAIWIVAGPVYYDTDNLKIGASNARVPSACFKAFLYLDKESLRAIAFVFQNGSNPGNIEDYAMSIDDLEKELGYDLFSALPDDIENAVEAAFSFSEWNK